MRRYLFLLLAFAFVLLISALAALVLRVRCSLVALDFSLLCRFDLLTGICYDLQLQIASLGADWAR